MPFGGRRAFYRAVYRHFIDNFSRKDGAFIMGQFTPARRQRGRTPPSLFRTLCVSMASIVLSLIMLVGTTMAWFTDTTTSATYTITAGNIGSGNAQVLSPAAAMSADGPVLWQNLPTTSDEGTLFSAAPYTPGTVQTVCLKLQNDGELPTRYRVSLQLVSEANDLSDLLQYGFKTFAAQDDLLAFAAQDSAALASAGTYDKSDALSLHSTSAYMAQGTTCQLDLADPGDAAYLALSIFMPADAVTTDLPADQTVQVQLTLIATQLAADTAPDVWDGVTATATESLQKDGETYLISSPADLAGAAAILRADAVQDCTLRLTADIDMNNQPWTPIDTAAAVTLEGNGYTIYNLNAAGGDNAGLFGTVPSLNASSLTFAGGSATASSAAGMLAGYAAAADLTAVCAQNIEITAPAASPLIGSGNVTENACNVSNYSIRQQ